MERIKVKLSDLGDIVGGATPSTINDDFYNGNIPWITPKDLSGHKERYIEQGERSISEAGLASCSTRIIPKGSILFSSRAPIGYVAIAKNQLCTNQGFKSIIPDDMSESLFIYYLLVYYKNAIEATASGTTFKEVSGSVMRQIEVIIPKSSIERESIAATLSCLDDKIELNNRIIANLEAQAQAFFKSWFVDFEPFQDGEFEDSELGLIPKGWKVDNLLGIADYLNGLAMQNYRPDEFDDGLPVLKIKELRQGCCDASSDRCSSLLESKYIVHDGDVIFSWSGSLMIDLWCSGDSGLNQHLFKVTSNLYKKWFYLLWTKHHLDEFISIAADKATTMGHIKREALEKALLVVPDQQIIDEADRIFEPLIDSMILKRVENRKLAIVRDTLLPKLMSGEIEVPMEG